MTGSFHPEMTHVGMPRQFTRFLNIWNNLPLRLAVQRLSRYTAPA
jgi:hypothetical protein